MNPTLYDVLGVPRDASRDEIRQAWREAADRFEPGSGGSSAQFRLFNEAAEVLLDPERRKAYDATLQDAPVQEREEEPAALVPDAPMPGTAHPVTAGAAAAVGSPSVVQEVHGRRWPLPGRRDETDGAASGPRGESSGEEKSGDASTERRGLPWWVLAVLGVVTAVGVGVAAYAASQAREAAAYQEAIDRAPAAAESAAAAILSYDHESLEADRDAAAKFLTDDYRGDYVDTFDKLVAENATKTKATVEAEVLASSAMLGGGDRDPERVPVLLFVDQVTTSSTGSGEP
ncbi:MAG TPA: J domain-containing protein, partial [Nocardioidaceae bacterium]